MQCTFLFEDAMYPLFRLLSLTLEWFESIRNLHLVSMSPFNTNNGLHISCRHAIPLSQCAAYPSGFPYTGPEPLVHISSFLCSFLFPATNLSPLLLVLLRVRGSFANQQMAWLIFFFLRSVLQLSDSSYFLFIYCVWMFDTKWGRIMLDYLRMSFGDVRGAGVLWGIWGCGRAVMDSLEPLSFCPLSPCPWDEWSLRLFSCAVGFEWHWMYVWLRCECEMEVKSIKQTDHPLKLKF